ncbi:hypothetical protein BHM03_00004595 [Ensete ventricosum]|nr:hypothetical protein BHM03_00004595 [Ensete ventricosum]
MMGQDQAWASGQGSDDVVGPCQEFARRFTEGIEKLAGNMPGDHRKKTLLQEYQRLSDCENISAIGPSVSGGYTIIAQDFEQLSVVELPRLGG